MVWSAGISRWLTERAAATCIAVGKLSLDDWPWLTWSLGWTGDLPPRGAGQDLVGAAGDHLIGVHVRLGARAGLPDDERELVVMHAARDLARRLLDRLGELGVEPAVARIDPRRRLLDEAQSVDDLDRHLLARAEREILDRALGLRAPIAIGRDLDRPEAVGFGARVGAHASPYAARFARQVSTSCRIEIRPSPE